MANISLRETNETGWSNAIRSGPTADVWHGTSHALTRWQSRIFQGRPRAEGLLRKTPKRKKTRSMRTSRTSTSFTRSVSKQSAREGPQQGTSFSRSANVYSSTPENNRQWSSYDKTSASRSRGGTQLQSWERSISQLVYTALFST